MVSASFLQEVKHLELEFKFIIFRHCLNHLKVAWQP